MNYLQQHDYVMNFLKVFDIDKPTQKQLNLAHKLLHNTSVQQHLTFSNKLTNREISCLFWAAKGLVTMEIAGVMGVKPSTVCSYKKNILRKLSCTTFTQAVFEGIRFGYIQPKLNN